MVKSCIFPSCKNTSSRTPQKLFLTMPQDEEKRKSWFEACGRRESSGRGYYVCEDHFNLERDAANWMYFKTMGDKIILKDGVIPSNKLATNSSESQLSSEERKRKSYIVNPVAIEQGVNTDLSYPIRQSGTALSDDAIAVYREVELDKCEKSSGFYLGLPQTQYFLINFLQSKLQVQLTCILIVLKKIKTNDEFARLAMDFAMTTNKAAEIFQQTLPKMASTLKELIIGLNRNGSRAPLTHYLELEVESFGPETWNKYKYCHTKKFAISCARNGLVNFVSQGYGGGTTVANSMTDTSDKVQIERVIRKIREFQMLELDTVVGHYMVQFLDDILVVVCGVVNFAKVDEEARSKGKEKQERTTARQASARLKSRKVSRIIRNNDRK